MKDVYLMDKETGELIPSEKAYIDFYCTHPWNDSIFDYFEETDLEVEDSEISIPDFTKTLNI